MANGAASAPSLSCGALEENAKKASQHTYKTRPAPEPRAHAFMDECIFNAGAQRRPCPR